MCRPRPRCPCVRSYAVSGTPGGRQRVAHLDWLINRERHASAAPRSNIHSGVSRSLNNSRRNEPAADQFITIKWTPDRLRLSIRIARPPKLPNRIYGNVYLMRAAVVRSRSRKCGTAWHRMPPSRRRRRHVSICASVGSPLLDQPSTPIQFIRFHGDFALDLTHNRSQWVLHTVLLMRRVSFPCRSARSTGGVGCGRDDYFVRLLTVSDCVCVRVGIVAGNRQVQYVRPEVAAVAGAALEQLGRDHRQEAEPGRPEAGEILQHSQGEQTVTS